MTKEQFFRKLLEAEIRGMLVGTYDTHNNLSEGERNAFFKDAIDRGLFLKNDANGTKYTSFDEMLTDLMDGKKILNLKTRLKEPGYFAFPKDMDAVYDDYTTTMAESDSFNDSVNLRTSFGDHGFAQIFNAKIDLASGLSPQIPGGWWSSAWNGIVKFFTGHSSEAWKEYDEYHEDLAMRNKIDEGTRRYEFDHNVKPGDDNDPFMDTLYGVDREGRTVRGEIIAEQVFPDRTRVYAPEELKEARALNQRQQDSIEYMQKDKKLHELDVQTYREFHGYDKAEQPIKSMDQALAVAAKRKEKKEYESLNYDAKKEIDARQEEMVGKGTFSTVVWSRTAETDKLLKDNALKIKKYLDANSVNPEFLSKVDAEMKALEKRCEDDGNSIFYTNTEDLNKDEIKIKLALQAMGVTGADKFVLFADKQIMEHQEMKAKHPYVPPVEVKYDLKTVEDHLNDGTITEAELGFLLKTEDDARSEKYPGLEKPLGFDGHEFYSSEEFMFDLRRAGLDTTKHNDQILAYKMMKAQDEVIESNLKKNASDQPLDPVPFFFKTEEEIEASCKLAVEKGFITQSEYDNRVVDLVSDEFEEEESMLDEQERLKAEENDKEYQEHERKVGERDAWKEKANSDKVAKDGVLNEYNRLAKLIEDKQVRGESFLQRLADKVEPSLKRAVDVKFGLEKYTEETAIEDLTNLIEFTECCQNNDFLNKCMLNQSGVENDIASNIKRNKMHEQLLGDDPKVDMLFFAKNTFNQEKKNLTINSLYKNIIKAELEGLGKAHDKNVQDSLKSYSAEQRALINDPVKMAMISTKLATQPDIGPDMKREEAELQKEASDCMTSLYNDYLMKPQGSGEEINIQDLSDKLLTIATYQSLANPEYRKAYQTMLGYSKLKDMDPKLTEMLRGKYQEMVKHQLDSSNILPNVMTNRASLADYVFGDRINLFQNIERYNRKSGMSFTELGKIELDSIKNGEKKLDAEYKKNKGTMGKNAAKAKYNAESEILGTYKNIMSDVNKNLKNGGLLAQRQYEMEDKAAQQAPVK